MVAYRSSLYSHFFWRTTDFWQQGIRHSETADRLTHMASKWFPYQCICFWPADVSEFMFRTLDCNTSDILSRSARPPENNRERTSPSGAAVPSWGRGCGRRPPPAPPRHVQRLPPLPRRWWEWLEGTCPDRVGGCSPFCPKTLLRQRQTLIHAVSWLCSSQGVAKPRAAYLSSCDTHTLTAVPSLQNTHVAIYLCEAIKNNYIMAEAHAAVEHHFKGEFTQKEKQNFTSIFLVRSFIYCSTLCQEMTFFLPPKVSVGPWKLRA